MNSRKTQKYAITLIFATTIGNCPYLYIYRELSLFIYKEGFDYETD